MTDLDKKVKEVVDEWWGIWEPDVSDDCIEDLVSRVKEIHQRDAQRREEEAVRFIVYRNNHRTYDPTSDCGGCDEEAKELLTEFRSREGQEGDKT